VSRAGHGPAIDATAGRHPASGAQAPSPTAPEEVPAGEEGADEAPSGLGPSDAPVADGAPPRPWSGREGGRPAPEVGRQLSIDLGPAAEAGAWRLPPLQLLKGARAQEVDRRMLEARGQTLEDALAAHGVETRLAGMTVGPTVTRYELELAPGVKVARVTSLQKDIAYAMAAPDIRLLAPIPGRSAIGVEVPNVQRQLVSLGDILATEDARKATHPLEVAVGRDIAGRPVMESLAAMPHLLIAGATGAGKSSCINSLLTSILLRATPDQVRLILVDPKRVELGQYNGLPHLLTQVVVNPKKAANALSWAVHEMERRTDLLSEVGVRDITGYNAAYDRGDLGDAAHDQHQRLPFILVVVDELNDLMMVAARDVEESVCRIAQMGRAFGIHLVIATQRPSVDVITGVIKANIPSRLAFAVSSLADSRVILDQPGAERLVGKGDMLLLTASSNVPRRIQGPWVTEEEVRKVVGHWRRQSQPQYVEGVEGDDGAGARGAAPGEEDDDDMLDAAMDLVVRSQLGSTSMLQRKLRVGFSRAGRLMDLLERRGVVGPSEGSRARAVLMTVEELEERQDSPTSV
jgi:S-DNA-T family DNA segregation ATPase FtsK/SpoIIIE